jgi:dTDP-4-amino-4,6-dideoxygalactose transaminase
MIKANLALTKCFLIFRFGSIFRPMSAPKSILFHKPFVSLGQSWLQALDHPGDAAFLHKAEQQLEAIYPTHHVLLTTSCTHALEMAAILTLEPGDEVIIPSYQFVSAANAVVLRGAKPVFIDIESQTLGINADLIQAAITPHTKAISVMHYGGDCAQIDSIKTICDHHGLVLIEDAAQCIGARDAKDRSIGSVGDFAAISFHFTKNIQCGEGGALLVSRQRPDYYQRALVLRDKGTNRQAFLNGAVDKYSWVDVGSSYSLAPLLGAQLADQLDQLDEITAHRHRLWHRYHKALLPLADRLILPHLPAGFTNGHVFYIVAPSLAERTRWQVHFATRNIGTAFHYQPLHSAKAGLFYGQTVGNFQVTDRIAAGLLRLPMHAYLTNKEQDRVVEAVFELF